MMRKLLFLLLFLLTIRAGLQAQTLTVARFYTNFGPFDVQLEDVRAPITTQNFISLVDTQFYDNTIWHRIIKHFVIQGGDPTGTGNGGPGYTIPDEFHPQLRHYKRGIISMANSGPNTGGSQFFICMKPLLYLDSLHSVFGQVINGMNILDSLENVPTNANDYPLTTARNDSIRILTPVGVDPDLRTAKAILGGNYPNPFHGTTDIYFGLREASRVELSIYDRMGRLIRDLVSADFSPGDHRIHWDGKDQHGAEVAPGAYFLRMQTPDWVGSTTLVRF
ncbi:MAG: peptidylprolyl isomerase [Bacteroidia bacterium]|nr:peptidylprolyl isomerase [Bacteroidia bacterium]